MAAMVSMLSCDLALTPSDPSRTPRHGGPVGRAFVFETQNFAPSGRKEDDFYFQMSLIRRFELSLLDLFGKGKIFGTTHTCQGQEADAVGVVNNLDRTRDTIWSNHRCHGHFLAYCGDPYRLYAEILGRKTGVCAGRGGSQHLAWGNFFSSGIQGGLVPLAVGTAFAKKREGALSAVFLGDGTMGEGTVYEGLNLASLWSAPVLFVVEDNGIAQTTDKKLGVAGDIAKRAEPFGVRSASIATTDVMEIDRAAKEATDYIRKEGKPFWLHIETVRLGPHSKGDDTRPADYLAEIATRDPLPIAAARANDPAALDAAVDGILSAALARALEDELAC
jgi:acetoin:2,6-dichlorophenolindophenol oxidoreductase subunit alpha